MPKQATRTQRRAPRRSTSDVQVIKLHPLIRKRVGPIDLRRTEIVRVDGGVAVDVIVRNTPAA